MAIEGTLDVFQLPEILQLVSHQDKTGILTVQGEADIVAISFLAGKVVAADSLNQTLEESLGEVLAGQGLVSPSDFSAVAAEHQSGGGRLIDLLVERGHVDRPGLLAALRFHTYRLLVELLSWDQGEFKFYGGDEVSFEEGFPPIAIEEVLIRSVTEAAGEGHPTIPDSWSFYDRVDSLMPVQVRTEGEDLAPPDPDVILVSEHESSVLEQMAHSPGGLAVADLVVATATDEYKVRYSLHRLLEAGLARVCEPSGDQVARKPPPRATGELSPIVGAVAPEAGGEAFRGTEALSVSLPEDRVDSVLLDDYSTDLGEILDPAVVTARQGVATLVWPGRLLGLMVAVLLVLVALRSPLRLPLPLPWQVADRTELEEALRVSIYQKVDRAAKTYYLIEGRFPNDLERLVEWDLLSAAELIDPLSRPLAITPQAESYVVQPVDNGRPVDSAASTEATTGNLLLDSRYLAPGEVSEEPAVVLLR